MNSSVNSSSVHSQPLLVDEASDSESHDELHSIPLSTQVESQDFENDESIIWRKHQLQRHFSDRGMYWTANRKRTAIKWIVTMLIGVLVGLTGVALQETTDYLFEVKFHYADSLIKQDHFFSAFMLYMAYNLIFVSCAFLLVMLEPAAAGSGVPEVRAYLNGLKIPRVMRIRTLVSKAIGICFSVSSGIPVGKEGPMIHCGAIIAAGISQGKGSTFGYDTSYSKFQDFRNDRSRRDFVTCGAAAGVAAAFSAPIGGIMFVLEEGASFWSMPLTWRAFFCAMLTLLTVFVVKNASVQWGNPNTSAMFSFGQFTSFDEDTYNFSVWELLIFVVIGFMGGVLGAAFIHYNTQLNLWRMKNVSNNAFNPWRVRIGRLLELTCICALMTCVSFGLPLLWSKCTKKPTDIADFTTQEQELLGELVPFGCDEQTEYNEVASLYFTNPDIAIRQLFHFREGPRSEETFSTGALLLYFVPYFCISCLCLGTAAPAGQFVPSLMSGAAIGRLVGHLLHQFSDANFADSGTYSLIGAAAVLSGLTRSTIAMTVMLLEATGDMQYILPLMVTVMAARYAGNVFNDGLYDVLINLKGLPFLDPNLSALGILALHPVTSVMSTPVKSFREVERVAVIYDCLKSTGHNGFPVVKAADGKTLNGFILRKQLVMILKKKCFAPPPPSELKRSRPKSKKSDPFQENKHYSADSLTAEELQAQLLDGNTTGTTATAKSQEELSNLKSIRMTYASALSSSGCMSWEEMECVYPRFPNITDIQVTDFDRKCVIDLRPYMNTSPWIIDQTSSIDRAFRFFRTMGLRHLCVVNTEHEVIGMLTRKDLCSRVLSERQWLSEGDKLHEATKYNPLSVLTHLDQRDSFRSEVPRFGQDAKSQPGKVVQFAAEGSDDGSGQDRISEPSEFGWQTNRVVGQEAVVVVNGGDVSLVNLNDS